MGMSGDVAVGVSERERPLFQEDIGDELKESVFGEDVCRDRQRIP